MKIKFLLLSIGLLLLCGFSRVWATDLTVRVLADRKDAVMNFSTILGQYHLSDANGNFIMDLNENAAVLLKVHGDNIGVYNNNQQVGVYPSLSFDGEGLKAIFSLYSDGGNKKRDCYYDDHLEVSVENNQLIFVNVVNMENYVAGVVQSEVRGISDKLDFYKVQAIISRTYAINNLKRHINDGYNLCDGVHCQVYKSRNNTPIILTATVQTADEVIVDSSDAVITAAFYSNSGGQTINSGDIWNYNISYLSAVEDTFSLSMKNTYWEKKMTKSEWLNFLAHQYKYPIHERIMRDSALSFEQISRQSNFCGNIPLKNIRRDMNLKSTFFSVSCTGEQVLLSGKGYGHGVGLSQEGAVRMVNLGYSVDDVIKFYYTGVNIKKLDQLPLGDLSD